MRKLEDDEIIALFKKKDPRAIEETKKKYEKMLIKAAENVLHCLEDAEECVNDTYMKLWESIPRVGAEKIALAAYALRINRNISINRLEYERARKRGGDQSDLSIDELEEVLSDPAGGFENRVLTESYVMNFLSTLSRLEQKVFIGRFWYFENEEAIAEKLDIKLSRVKSTVRRCRVKFIEKLKEDNLDVRDFKGHE